MAKKLSDKQKRFCEEYLIDLNATQAAIRSGYSKKTAQRIGSENLSKPLISERIAALQKKRSDRIEINADMVLEEIHKMAFVKESEFYHDDGSVKLLSELTDDQKAALKSYTVKQIPIGDGEYETIPVFMVHDKQKSLEMFMKHLGLYEKDNTINVKTEVIDPFADEN